MSTSSPFSVNLPDDLREWLTAEAARRDVPIGHIIREALRFARAEAATATGWQE